MADPATFLASHSVLRTLFPLRTACLFTDAQKHILFLNILYYYLINIVKCITILNMISFYKSTYCPFNALRVNKSERYADESNC